MDGYEDIIREHKAGSDDQWLFEVDLVESDIIRTVSSYNGELSGAVLIRDGKEIDVW